MRVRLQQHLIDFLEFLADIEAVDSPSTQDLFFQRFDLEIIQSALKALPEEQQTALYLSVVSGKSREEIADLTGTKVETVKKRLYRARKKLKEALEAQNGK